ncbi:hypothetical protein BSL82_01250 [Tardibacter chloracetimidivorans]|uniref:Uncharacterized protein n=1 Tax=Tardibacter chloracetimidivorans TaxID=1921510 RepID=A0A1L3ZR53_9SPHN|nr:hypothetical protein [Tardibacter chloracetimidivorans]API58090.1 hypothetical protein BSL82_01250 [Tardibacter chloracetimidivorans]
MADELNMNDPKVKAAIKEAVAAAVAEATEGLEAKNAELLTEKKDLQKKLRQQQDIKPEDLQAAEDARDKALSDLAEVQKQVKALTTERDKAVKALETENGFTQRLLIQDGLKTALLANGVKDEDFIDSLTAKFSGGASIKVDGDSRLAMYGDKPLGDFIKEWAASDTGKKFVAAPGNSGGGAGGGGQGGGGKTVTRQQWDGMDHGARAAFAKDGGKVVDAAA